ncbi:histidine kinase, partial [Duganella callida]
MMASARILQVGIASEPDVVTVRQRARQIAGLLGYGVQDQVRIATAVSEVARCAYAHQSGGRAAFAVDQDQLRVTISADGASRQPQAAAELKSVSITARRLMDDCSVAADAAPGLRVELGKA